VQNVGQGDRIVLTEMEHHSNVVPWYLLARQVGAELDWVPVTDEGRLDVEALGAALERGPKIIAVAHVSNVLGTINPIAEISRMAHDAGALVLVDGAQAAPKMPLGMAQLGADFYGFTGHKLLRPDRRRGPLGSAGAARRDGPLRGRWLDDPQGHQAGDHLGQRAGALRGRHAADRRGRGIGGGDRVGSTSWALMRSTPTRMS